MKNQFFQADFDNVTFDKKGIIDIFKFSTKIFNNPTNFYSKLIKHYIMNNKNSIIRISE